MVTLPTSEALKVCVVPMLPTLNPALAIVCSACACGSPTTFGTTAVRLRK